MSIQYGFSVKAYSGEWRHGVVVAESREAAEARVKLHFGKNQPVRLRDAKRMTHRQILGAQRGNCLIDCN